MAFKKKDANGRTRNSRLLAYADLIEQGQPVDEGFLPLVKEIVGEYLLERKELLDLIQKVGIKDGPTYDVKPFATKVLSLEDGNIPIDIAQGVREMVENRRVEGKAALSIQLLLVGGHGPSDIGDLPSGPIN